MFRVMDGFECAGFEFFSNFDSANIAKVEYVPPNESVVIPASNTGKSIIPEIPDVEFNIWTKPDCCGTEFENGNRTWFYFGIRGFAPGLLVKLNMVDLNRQAKLYSQGMAPVYRIVPGKSNWERIRDKPTYNNDENIFTLSFKYRTPENVQSITYFAFTFPYSYVDLQHALANVDFRFLNCEITSKDDIYYMRECICNSLEGRHIDLITLSSYYNISAERETRLKNLFPDHNVPRPFRFLGKKVIFVSARVHPGETPSSFVFNGLLNLLLNREDPIAIILRRLYVFKLIPFLNPDGVSRGHYRTDTRGVNLNRVYLNPSVTLHPSVYAARALIRYYHYGYEKEDEEQNIEANSEDVEESSCNDDSPQSDNKLSKKVSHMSLEENKNSKNLHNTNSWCDKCKANIMKLEDKMPGISSIIPSFNHNSPSVGKDLCINCGDPVCNSSSSASVVASDIEESVVYSHGDVNCNESGLFLYMDMHGHASKKGIFMYGNHFEDLEQNVECMLLPKIMSINNHNFHFTACNFTEKNMYLRDRRDGMSREGSGRVAVLKLTGLVRSYTLECNYNTGRIVNVLPSTIRESSSRVHTLPVPPKYNPQVFEEVGKALGASILDLTGQNPSTRLPNSEFHTLNGLREWLRVHCTNELGETRSTPAKLKIRNSTSLHTQGKSVRAVIVKTRSTSAKTTPKKITTKAVRSTSVPIERKENIVYNNSESNNMQPCCSNMNSGNVISRVRSASRSNKNLGMRSKVKKDASLKFKNNSFNEKQSKTSLHGNSSCLVRQKTKLQTIKEKKPKMKQSANQNDLDRVQLREICFIKEGGSKKVIAKYSKSSESTDLCEDNLIVAWDASNSNPQVFSHKDRTPCVQPMIQQNKVTNEAGPSKKSAFRVHNFTRSSSFSKGKRNKRSLRRLTSATESPGKVEKLKKRKKLKTKVS